MPREGDEHTTGPRSTVGSLFETPQSEARPVRPDEPEGQWAIRAGRPFHGGGQGFDPQGVEQLDYSNPYGLTIERVWFDRKIVFATESGEMDIDPSVNKVAQEYQIVYDVQLDERGKLVREPERVPNQFNIYDSIPGMDKYSPIWQFNYVVVPRAYVPNTLRSEADCLRSGYPIVRSNVFEN
jgi:hypothetical protein